MHFHAVGSPPRPVTPTPNSRPTTPASESPLGDVGALGTFFSCSPRTFEESNIGKMTGDLK